MAAQDASAWEGLSNGGAFARAAEVFRKYDVDGSGELDKEELVAALTELGVLAELDAKHAGRALDQQMRDADANGDGRISWREFGEFYNRLANLKAAELRAGRLKGRGKPVVPSDLFSDPAVQAAFSYFSEFGGARGLGDKAASAGAARLMSSQQFKRMLETTGLMEGLGGSAAAVDIVFTRSRPAGATKLRFQSFLNALALLAEENGVPTHQVVQQLVACAKKRAASALPPSADKKCGARPASSPALSSVKAAARRAESPAGSPRIATRPSAAALDFDAAASPLPRTQQSPLPAVAATGPCLSLLARMGHIQRLLDPAAAVGASPGPLASTPPAQPSDGRAGGMVPMELMQLFVRELLAQQAATPASAEAAAKVAAGQPQPEGWYVVNNESYNGPQGSAAAAGQLEVQECAAKPGEPPTALSSLEAHTLKVELWRNLEARCGAAEARCAAMVAARAAASEHTLAALRLGLAGLQEEAATAAAAEAQAAAAQYRLLEDRCEQLQRQVDALEEILNDSMVPAQAAQEVRAAREECARAVAAVEERMAAREKTMGEALLAMARRVAELDARTRGSSC